MESASFATIVCGKVAKGAGRIGFALMEKGGKWDDDTFVLDRHRTLHAAAIFHHPVGGLDLEAVGRLREEQT